MPGVTAGRECRRRVAPTRWCSRLAAPASFAALLLLVVHLLSALRSSSHTHWDADVAFSSDPGATAGAAGAAGGTNHLDILMRSLGKQRIRRQAASVPAGGTGSSSAGASSGRAASAPPPPLPPPPQSNQTLFVTFGNTAFFDFTHNWVLSVKRLGVAYVVGALDRAMSEKCAQHGFAVIDLWQQQPSNSSRRFLAHRRQLRGGLEDAEKASESGDASDFFRANFSTFRSMGATKVQFTLSLLEADNGFGTVVVSDSDVAWMRDPTDHFAQHPSADWFISTDCLSHEVEVAWQPGHNQPRCGHIPGNIWGRAYNTGKRACFAVRNRPAARRLLELWRDMLLAPEHSVVVEGTNTTFGITDQLALNMLLEEGSEWKLDADPEDRHTTLLRNGTLRLHPLPVLLFPGGHVAFVQRLPWKHGVEPYVVHATFQRYSTGLSRYGKRGRFRQFGMWLLDGPEYFSPPGARYLTYQNNVRQYIHNLTAARFGGVLPLLHKHIIAMSFQLAQFRDALAVSKMLNRTLVLPKSWCWCDYDWTPHIVEKCKIRGSDLRLPFECPADFVFHIPAMDLNEHTNTTYRVPGFLEDPRAPPELSLSRAELRVADRAARRAALAGGGGGGSLVLAAPGAAAGVLYLGSVQHDVLAVAAPLEATAVVELTHMRPGLIRGFDRLEDSLQFDQLYKNITEEMYWCCAAEGGFERAAFWYELPWPFGEIHTHGHSPWEPPGMARPEWCDSADLSPGEKEWTSYANHPCQFLANATAAAIASQLS
ncbi:hypothetical protein ABPG75_000490 [Micractinium tetrahymenae]